MKRLMYVSQLKKEHVTDFKSHLSLPQHALTLKDWLASQGIVTCSLYIYDRQLFLYMECLELEFEFSWPPVFLDWLEWWPGEHELRKCVPMLDIFHDGYPITLESWRGERVIEQRIGSLARLKPEMYSSYVFYHFQGQEEMTQGFNKTYLIGAYENYIFSYQEHPAVVQEKAKRDPMKPSNSPPNWHEVMYPHFQLWEDTSEKEKLWRVMETVFSF